MSGSHEPAMDGGRLRDAIVAIRDEWIAQNRIADARAVGDGLCYEFAAAVMARISAPGHGAGLSPNDADGRVVDCVTEDWWARMLDEDGEDVGEAEPFVMDVARLRREGAPLPDPQTIPDDELAVALGAMTHNWLVLDGRHHDATCPEGADHFLLMPFFADQIRAIVAQRESKERP